MGGQSVVEQVEETTALVLGCGGLGNGVALGLCRLGVRKLILVDMDLVEPSNLNRQVQLDLCCACVLFWMRQIAEGRLVVTFFRLNKRCSSLRTP